MKLYQFIHSEFQHISDSDPCITCFSRQGQFTIVPVMVGSLSTERELMYGHIFSKYLADPANLFVISSDFCHWGMYTSFFLASGKQRFEIGNNLLTKVG